MRDATQIKDGMHIETAISIHASHAGRDEVRRYIMVIVNISIHASHAGRDGQIAKSDETNFNFNPRVPCGTRQ